jgi:hypothetical protein
LQGRKHSFLKHAKTQEEFTKIQVEHKLERVQERLVEAWPEIRKVAPQLPESSDAGEPEHQIELLQGAWSQLAIHAENMEVSCGRVNKKQRNNLRSCKNRWRR